MSEEKKLRIFKVEYDGQDPVVTTGDILLEQVIKESCEEFPFNGATIDDAFKYFSDFDSIQECELPEDLRNIYQQLQTAKEEIIRLQSNDCFYVELDKKNELLTQQNKQMRENINNIKNLCNEDWEDMTVDKFQNQLLQSLKEVNNEK